MTFLIAVLGLAQQRSQAVIDIGLKKTEQVHDTVVVSLNGYLIAECQLDFLIPFCLCIIRSSQDSLNT